MVGGQNISKSKHAKNLQNISEVGNESIAARMIHGGIDFQGVEWAESNATSRGLLGMVLRFSGFESEWD